LDRSINVAAIESSVRFAQLIGCPRSLLLVQHCVLLLSSGAAADDPDDEKDDA
jgi:hypothetical protein